RELSRAEFCERLRRILAAQFPDDSVESLAISADLEHTLSGNYARGLFQRGSSYTPFLAVPDDATPDMVRNSLTFGLLWLDRARQLNRPGNIMGLRLILPRDTSAGVAQLLSAVDSSIPIALWELDSARETLRSIDPGAVMNLDIRLVPHRETETLLAQAQP